MGFSDSLVGKESVPWFDSWVGKIHWRRDRLPTLVFLGFRCDSAGKESACNARDLGSIPGSGRSSEERDRQPTSVLGFPGGSGGKESTCNARDLGSIPGLGRSPGEGIGYPLQYSGLKNSMVGSPWGHTESDMMSDFHFHTLICKIAGGSNNR